MAQKIIRFRLTPEENSLLEIQMIRARVTNVSGYIKCILFKNKKGYEIEKIQRSQEEIQVEISRVPEHWRSAYLRSKDIDMNRLCGDYYVLQSAYNEIIARYDKDRNSSIFIHDQYGGFEPVITWDGLGLYYRKLDFQFEEYIRKFKLFIEFVKGTNLNNGKPFWPEIPEFNEYKDEKKDEEKSPKISQYYFSIFNKKGVRLALNEEEYSSILKQSKDEGWENFSGYIKEQIFGEWDKTQDKVIKIIREKRISEQVIVLCNYAEKLIDNIRFIAYKYEKKMDELKEKETKVPQREKYVRGILMSAYLLFVKEQKRLEYLLKLNKIQFTVPEEPEFNINDTPDAWDMENDMLTARRLEQEWKEEHEE